MINGYYYLHDNGELIYKPNSEDVVADLRDSDLVKMFWAMDMTSRLCCWSFLIEALAIGAKKSRVEELAKKWNMTDDDGSIYCEKIGVILKKDGDAWCVHKKDFTCLPECPSGFGDTVLEALSEFCKELNFTSTKLNWHKRFEELVKPNPELLKDTK